MKLSPALNIEIASSRMSRVLALSQLLLLGVLFWVLPLPAAGLAMLLGSWSWLRSWRAVPTVRRISLLGDGLTRFDEGADTMLIQAQNFLGILVLEFSNNKTLWLWPDMLGKEDGCALRRWLSLHGPSAPDSIFKAG